MRRRGSPSRRPHAAVPNEVLEEMQPRYVVLYDPDPGFIRAIELAQAMAPSVKICVYFLMQKDSVEEQRYRSTLRIEREAFQKFAPDEVNAANERLVSRAPEADVTPKSQHMQAGTSY